MVSRRTKRMTSESGVALVVALLALTLLTLLGITMSVTTSTEQQISANYRWSQQASYNAESGLEIARNYLRQFEWNMVLPTARNGAQMTAPPVWAAAPGLRASPIAASRARTVTRPRARAARLAAASATA